MYTKISGGGYHGNMPNTGSCAGLADYLGHDKEEYYANAIKSGDMDIIYDAIAKGDIIMDEYFFDQNRDDITRDEVVHAIDANHSKLKKTDEKFYHLMNAPSQSEIKHIPGTQTEKISQYRAFIREDVMGGYAENAKRDIKKEDLLYFGKIHSFRSRDTGNLLGMHCHNIVSRKTKDGKKQLSPLSNHRNSTKGAVKGGFDRTEFYSGIEKAFDRRFGYERKYTESFEYLNARKNGTNTERAEALMLAAKEKYGTQQQERPREPELAQEQKAPQKQERKPDQEQEQEQQQQQPRRPGLRF